MENYNTTNTMNLSTYIVTKITLLLNKTIFLIKTNWLISSLIAVVAFFEPISLIFHFILFGVLLDLVSGLFKAWVKKEKITSSRLRDTAIKLFLYVGLVALIYGIQLTCMWGLPIANIVAAFLLFAEAVSISENLDEITGKKLGIALFIKKIRNKYFNKKDNEMNNK